MMDKPAPKPHLQDVLFAVANEGFDYAFRNYSSFDEVDDAEFHRLRLAYCAAADALEKYLGPTEE